MAALGERISGGSMISDRSELAPRAHLPIEEPTEEPPSPEKLPDDDPPIEEPPIEDPSALDQLERFLLLVFLRRYVTHRARRRRFAQMNGTARLFAEVRANGNACANVVSENRP